MRFRTSKLLLTLTTVAALAASGAADAGTLKVNVAARGNQRATWQNTFEQFRKANPDIDLKVSYIGEEAFKVQMSGWLATDPPDVVSWNNGERLAYFAKRGLIEDLTPDWQKNGWNATYAAVKQSSTYGASSTAFHSAMTRMACFTARTCSTRPAFTASRPTGRSSSRRAAS